MMSVDEAVKRIRELQKTELFLVATGAGAGLQDMLWSEPGISSVLSGAAFTYHTLESDDFVGFTMGDYCSKENAYYLASSAFIRAASIGYRQQERDRKSIGLAISASVASEKAHRGDHRIHVAVVSDNFCGHWSLILPKGVGKNQRIQDGMIADIMGLDLLYYSQFKEWVGLTSRQWDWVEDPVLEDTTATSVTEPFWARPLFYPNQTRSPVGPATPLSCVNLFPGNFNPPHYGHEEMAATAESATHNKTICLVNVDNPHKPEISGIDLLRRAAQFRAYKGNKYAACFTRGEPLFIDKFRNHPRTRFIVGSDTIRRFLNPKWGPSVAEILNEMERYDITFLSFDRIVDGKMLKVDDVLKEAGVPEHYVRRFVWLPGQWNVSSSELRNLNTEEIKSELG